MTGQIWLKWLDWAGQNQTGDSTTLDDHGGTWTYLFWNKPLFLPWELRYH